MRILNRINQDPNNNWTDGTWTKTIIVIHATVSPEREGGALQVAGWFADPDFNASTQYVVDNRDVVQCVPERAYAWAAGTTANKRGIHIELVAMPQQTRSEWNDDYSNAELALAARLVAELCAKHNIAVRKLTPGELRAGMSGICGHDDVRDAWGETTHWDPGEGFPWARFIRMVQAAAAEPEPAPEPVVPANPARVPMTRGANVDDSIRGAAKALREAKRKGAARRQRVLWGALVKLRSLPKWPKK